MNIFYTASYYGKQQYQKEYSAILNVLEAADTTIISPEKGNYLDLILPTDPLRNETAKHIHYEAIRRGIAWADAVVLEVSNEDFQLGHEMTLAIQAKKHVLCLSLHENFERKIFSKYFHGAKYTLETLEPIIGEFLKTCQKELLPNRFNFFISNSQVKYLEEKAKSENMSVSEYLRKLIDDDRER